MDALTIFWESHLLEDWTVYRQVVKHAKWGYFKECIHEAATTNRRPWDLTAWTWKRNLPSHEAISFRGLPCVELGDLWAALDGTYNAAEGRAIDLSYLDPLPPLPIRDWVPFSTLELQEALAACSSCSSTGLDHVTWFHLKHWCRLPGVALLFTHIAEACLTLGH